MLYFSPTPLLRLCVCLQFMDKPKHSPRRRRRRPEARLYLSPLLRPDSISPTPCSKGRTGKKKGNCERKGDFFSSCVWEESAFQSNAFNCGRSFSEKQLPFRVRRFRILFVFLPYTPPNLFFFLPFLDTSRVFILQNDDSEIHFSRQFYLFFLSTS